MVDGRTTRYAIEDPGDLATPLPSVIVGDAPQGGVPALPACPVVLCFGTPGFDAVRAGWLDRPTDGSTLLFDRQGSQSMVFGAAMAATVPAARRILLGNVFEMMAETSARDLGRVVNALPPCQFDLAFVKTGVWGVLGVDRTSEHPYGAYDVPMFSTIGSGDVFAGVLGGLMAGPVSALDAAGEAVAAAGAWIASDAELPPPDLAACAAAVAAAGPAVWVDRRQLEDRRFSMVFDDDTPRDERERVARGLRYLGMEMLIERGSEMTPIDLRNVGGGRTGALARAVAWTRSEFGVVNGADRGPAASASRAGPTPRSRPADGQGDAG